MRPLWVLKRLQKEMTSKAMQAWGIKEGDKVKYRYYDNPRQFKGIVAWNYDEQDYVIQCYTRSDIEYCGQYESDYIEIVCVDDMAVIE